ncbi:hypothetical protein [Pseudocnuella soli]|uniref:hypothetical protein n=1 Tax=Pseudocnuella soli TaxID=2502779 RepID=UPI0010435D91|nr:hypothetical protein [Pseudocnuella soli]
MAIDKTRFTLLAFPQSVDATGKLSLNLVFLPRNISPLDDVRNEGTSIAPPFVSVQPQFTIKIGNNPSEFPGKLPAPPHEVTRPMDPIVYSTQAADIYKTLKDAKQPNGVTPKYFDIDESRSADRAAAEKFSIPKALPRNTAVRKYLPFSYREAFNFTAPRVPNAVTDDSYHCAVRDDKPDPTFAPSDGKVSWGKVYAHLMRQPLMAKAAGLIYNVTVQLSAGDLEKGGWIYADILTGDYSAQQAASEPVGTDPFIKKYAAKIPPLEWGEARSLFAAVLFPVMKSGQNPEGIFDELFIESARYNDGFAGLVHSYQPRSHNLLVERADGFHPQKEMGIRLGWDDEQILIWYLRQIGTDENLGDKRLDAPLGVTGYCIDVRQFGGAAWESLTEVVSNGALQLETINMGNYAGELPYQVYPTKLAGSYWLPMYFANWNDQCMVLPDKRAAEIYANAGDTKHPATLSDMYTAPAYTTKLLYGNQYEFRVRMRDMSGGGPGENGEPEKALPGMITTTHFKRYIAPNALLLRHTDTELKPNTDDVNFTPNSLKMQRPLLGYPAVLYTGRYVEADALTRLRQNRDDNFAKQALDQPIDGFGIPDLDVVKVQVKVEVETLKMDNLASDDGREHYITLYTTYRTFDAANPDALLEVPINWKDQPILKLGNITEPFDNVADNDTIAQTAGTIVLPTARDIRMTIRACCEGTADYWGNYSETNPDLDARLGKTTVLSLRKESAVETDLFTGTEDPQAIQGILLQPDPLRIKLNPIFFKTLDGNNTPDAMSGIVQRFAKQLDVHAKELTITAPLGERIAFWCSNMVRHTMAPDSSSITFSGTNELQGHWLVCTSFYINRDWTWDSLDALSFIIERRRKQGREADDISAKPWQQIGSLDLQRIASFQAIQEGEDGLIHREYTKIILIDVVDGKPPIGEFPDVSQVSYKITPRFKTGHTPTADGPLETPALLLPATVNPTQMPKLVGAGIALSPYKRNKQYSATEARKRYLWLEFDRKPDNEADDLFARVLAYAPDQLLSNNDPSLLEIPEESNLPIDPEYIRVITPASSPEHAGLNAMQKMIKSDDKDRHFYILPLPLGLHGESTELFGFFTYEFRFGHSDRLWSTAQGRFGRPLRVAGLQHPAPNLLAMVSRDEQLLRVSAPFAKAVLNGKNVTSNPPRTSIWCLLYAQVRQADGLDFRNILLAEKRLEQKPPSRHREWLKIKMGEAGNNPVLIRQFEMEYVQKLAREKEATWQAYGAWQNKEIREMLYLYGLPEDAPLSILCVEVYGQITNIYQHMNDARAKKEALISSIASNYDQTLAAGIQQETYRKMDGPIPDTKPIDPLKTQLGSFRILRTSPLTEVPFICCTDC